MNTKLTLLLVTSTLLLTSCSGGGDSGQSIKNTTAIGSGIVQKTATGNTDIEAFREKRKEAVMKNMKEEEKNIFTELDKVRKSWDRQKEEQVLIEIHKLEEIKRKELEAAVKSGDTKKAVELRKYLSIFSDMWR